MEELNERIAKLETTVQEHSKVIEKQNQKNDELIEMKTLIKMQTDINAETKEQIKEFGKILVQVNENLTNLNSSQNQLGNRVTEIEGTLSKSRINLVDIIKYVGMTGLGLIIAWIYVKLGLTKTH